MQRPAPGTRIRCCGRTCRSCTRGMDTARRPGRSCTRSPGCPPPGHASDQPTTPAFPSEPGYRDSWRPIAPAHRCGPNPPAPASPPGGSWRTPRHWLGDDVLVSDRSGAVAGYVRRRVERDHVNVLELGVATDDLHLGRVLLAAAAEARQ